MLKRLGYEKQSGSTKVHRDSCRVNPTVTGERCWDLDQSKAKIIQGVTGVITVGHLATTRQINKCCCEFFPVLYDSAILYKFFCS
ncbi:hypothetical protein I79_007316 [Cricetulus griseus]|uniref:Uncharacterized protein n=1 Tax=Cricetulus griseus TaxID=10029 RepID=G3HA73_CRIGR|nr:hypothetical protein I79_007316 [Cricetulus griseus]